MAVTQTELLNWDSRKRAKFVNTLSGFKPLNLIGTKSVDGIENLAIFNSVFHLGASPPLIGMISRPDSVDRHTLSNIKLSGSYTINAITESIYEKAHQTSARYSVSEFNACGLTPMYANDCYAPFVNESPLKIEVKLIRTIPIEENGTIMIIGSIESVEFDKKYLSEDGYLNIENMGLVCGSSLDGYHKTDLISRLSYAKPDKQLDKIK